MTENPRNTMVCDAPYLPNEFGAPDFFYVFNIILSFSTCSQSLKKNCTWEILGANVLKLSSIFQGALEEVTSAKIISVVKALANEDTSLPTHCWRHKCFPVCPRAQHLSRTEKIVSDFVQKHFVSATNVSQFAQPKKHHGQQCVRNNVSSFARALSLNRTKTQELFTYF